MVEFGLKLEDNKVAEWRENYIDYEKLKQILKKCAAANARYLDLKAKQPERAEQIRCDFESGQVTPLASNTPWTSTDNLQMAMEAEEKEAAAASAAKASQSPINLLTRIQEAMGSSRSTSSSIGIEATSSPQSEQVPLAPSAGTLITPVPSYGSTQDSERSSSANALKRSSSTNALTMVLERATSSMTGYFSKSYERQVREALKDMAQHSRDFETNLQNEITRVNTFYQSSLKECEERLTLLKETVHVMAREQQQSAMHRKSSTSSSITIPPVPPSHGELDEEITDNDAYLDTPLLASRKLTATWFKMEGLAHAIKRIGSSATEKRSRTRTSEGISIMLNDDDDDEHELQRGDGNEEEVRRTKEAQSVQRALVDTYRRTKLLHNFAILNYIGFVKIVKKHDKTLKEEKNKYKQAIRPENICDEGKSVELLSAKVERLYANWFCGRNMSEARAQLLPKKDDGLQMDWSQLRLGYRMGMCTVLGLWVCWDCIWGLLSRGNTTIGSRTAFPVFRAFGGLLLLQWFWGCSVWVWTRYRINYIFIMDLDPSIVESPLAIFNAAVDDTLVFLLSMLLYYKAGAHDIPGNLLAGIFPAFVVVYCISRLVFPLRTRLPAWRNIWKVVTAPMYSPGFLHSYIGDIFTSMVKVFQDLAWTVCFMLSGDWLISEDSKHSMRHPWSQTVWYSKILIPLLTLLPLWFRFNQCLRRYMDTRNRVPHLANAFKYALSQTVTLFGAFHPLYMANTGISRTFQVFWMFAFIASSLYSFTWDVYMDWGLGLPEYNFLGPRLMYPRHSSYYAIIAVDLVLRFAWVLTLVPPNSGANFALPAYLTMVSMMLELFRRTVWGFLRLENEHRNNTAGFRSVGFVPLHFTTGHAHQYKHEKEHRGVSVLFEVAVVTLAVLGVSVASVVAAQHATELSHPEL